VIGTRPLRILVVDDDPAMVGAITALVGTEGHQVITAYDGLTAVKRYREERPDLVLLDLAMPGPDGFTVIGQLRASGNVPVLVVSGESAEAAKVKALGIGADDYLVKPFGMRELLARIRAVSRRTVAAAGTEPESDQLRTVGTLTIDRRSRRVRVGDDEIHLTPTEFDLLAYLAAEPGAVHRRADILRDVWQTEWYGATKTLDAHVAAIRRKLGDANWVQSVRGVGFRFESPG